MAELNDNNCTLYATCGASLGNSGDKWWVKFPRGTVVDGLSEPVATELLHEIKTLYADACVEGISAAATVVHERAKEGSDA